MARNGETDDLRDRPIGELLKQLATETTTLVRQELELAKAEFTEKGRKAGVGFGMWGAAGASIKSSSRMVSSHSGEPATSVPR